jgi:uncharacterized protein (DUF305 family)
MRNTLATILAVAALVTAAACSTSTTNQSNTTAAGTTSSASAAAPHNQVDVMFAQHMIPHHQQAIQMSDMVLGKQSIDPRVIDLANQIKAAQGPEIEQMQSWLSQWGQPTMPMMPGGSMMPSTSMMPGMSTMPSQSVAPSTTSDPHHSQTTSPSATPNPSGMPGMPSPSAMPGMPGMDGMMGMMSEADMTALQNAQGVDASKLFLTQMIQHHQGAIMMAQHEIDGGQYHPTVELARSIVTSQQKEINTMQAILASL